MTEEIDEDYASWEGELGGKPRTTPVNQCGCGFFRVRTIKGLEPVGIWRDEQGDLLGHVGDKEEELADAEFAEKVYSRAKAVEEQAYRDHIDGKGWPEDVNPHEDQANSTGDQTLDATIKDKIERLELDAKKAIKALKGGKIRTQTEADTIANLGAEIARLAKQGEDARVAAVKPHLDAQRAINSTWNAVKTVAGRARDICSAPVTRWQVAERARKQAEFAAKAAEGKPIRASELSTKAGTTTGMILRTSRELQFTDLAQTKAHYLTDSRLLDHPSFLDAIGKLAKADLIDGKTVPGASLKDVQKSS